MERLVLSDPMEKRERLDHQVLLATLEDLETRETRGLKVAMVSRDPRGSGARTGWPESGDRRDPGASGAGWGGGGASASPDLRETPASRGHQVRWVRRVLLVPRVPGDPRGSPACLEFLARMASLDLRGSGGHRGSTGLQATKGLQGWLDHRDPLGSQDLSESPGCPGPLEYLASQADLARQARKVLQALLVPKDGLAFLDHLASLDSLVREVCLVYPACLGSRGRWVHLDHSGPRGTRGPRASLAPRDPRESRAAPDPRGPGASRGRRGR